MPEQTPLLPITEVVELIGAIIRQTEPELKLNRKMGATLGHGEDHECLFCRDQRAAEHKLQLLKDAITHLQRLERLDKAAAHLLHAAKATHRPGLNWDWEGLWLDLEVALSTGSAPAPAPRSIRQPVIRHARPGDRVQLWYAPTGANSGPPTTVQRAG